MSLLDEEGFVLKSPVRTEAGRLVLVVIRYAREEEQEQRHGRHHIQEADPVTFDRVITATINELETLRSLNRLLVK